MRGSAVELFDDCPHCLLEGGLVETYDARVPACRFGVPARVTCKLCGLAKVGRVAAPKLAPDLTRVAGNRCPACIEELSAEALDVRRCGQCGAKALLVDEVAAADLTSYDALLAQLDTWARREGFPSVDALLSATFVVVDLEHLFEMIRRGAPLETVADPFSLGGRAGGGRPRDDAAKAPPPVARPPAAGPPGPSLGHEPIPTTAAPASRPKSQRAPAFRVVPSDLPPPAPASPAAPPPHDPSTAPHAPQAASSDDRVPLSAPPRAILFPLVSVVAADGEVHAAERAFVDAFLASEGMTPLRDDEFKVYTPAEAARYVPKERREKIVELMCELATVDGLGDEAELRVVRAYAAAWRVPEEKVETWLWGYEHAQASAGRQFWLRIRRFLLSSRWERTDP